MRLSSGLLLTGAGFAANAYAQAANGTVCNSLYREAVSDLQKKPNATTFYFKPSAAFACLQEVPLSATRAAALVEYIASFMQYQSDLEYLKDPPKGYLVPGVDMFGGFDQVLQNLKAGKYPNQYTYEKDMHDLINVLPHDGHVSFRFPLSGAFSFQSSVALTSISEDGLSIPEVYIEEEVARVAAGKASYTPSPIVAIDGRPVFDVLQDLSQGSGFQDPDALYNQMFYTAPLFAKGSYGAYAQGAFTFHNVSDYSTYSFANGTSRQLSNIAVFSGPPKALISPQVLFTALEDGPSTTRENSSVSSRSFQGSLRRRDKPTLIKRQDNSSVTSLPNYPNPIVIQPEGYTSGYFLDTKTGFGDTAVLAVNSFQGDEGSKMATQDQQKVISEFLAACAKAGKKKLIVDLSDNPGGSLFNGYDLAKQLVPSLVPFGGSRYLVNPAIEYFIELFSTAAYNVTYNSIYQIQASLDVDLKPFTTPQEMYGPHVFQNTNFSSELRYNLSDPTQSLGSGIVVSGYANRSDLPSQVFALEDIVLLLDGACSSTCTTFTGLLKGQLNVRTIAVGGRPLNLPMQGVGGIKGAQAFEYSDMLQQFETAANLTAQYKSENKTLPSLPADIERYTPNNNDPPLGQPLSSSNSPGFNLRNAYKPNDPTQTPEQYIYEAANCRLFYTATDLYNYGNLWARVANVAWGNGTCVPGSTVNTNNSISSSALPFTPAVVSNATVPTGPGSLPRNGTSTLPSGTSIMTPSPTATSTPSHTAGAAGLEIRLSATMACFAVAVFAVLM